MARPTLATLITRIRSMIDDPAGAGAVFTDDEIQDALDRRRDEARYLRLDEKETITPNPGGGTTTTYVTFDAPVGDWESASLVDSSYEPITPLTSDLDAGRWTTSTEPDLPVMLSGFTHDLYGAASDLLLTWASKEALAFDVTADGTNLARSQKAQALRAQAYGFAAKARTGTANLVRLDEWC